MNIAARKNCKGSQYKGVWKEIRRGRDVCRARIKTSAGGKSRTVNCGSNASELLASLVAKLRNGIVVEGGSDRHVFNLLLLPDRSLLATEVARILCFDFALAGSPGFDLHVGQFGRHVAQPRPVNLGTTQDFLQ